jgi:hypothetical protein
MTEQQRPFSTGQNEGTPTPGERVMVITGKSRCHGSIDGQGVWRLDKDGSPIEDVIGWKSFD